LDLLLKGGHVIDPDHLDGVMDILVRGGKIVAIHPKKQQKPTTNPSEEASRNVNIIDCAGKVVAPGFIDIHVHFREPGFEHKETIETGCRAAAHGGFTAVCTMPNTRPANHEPGITAYVLKKAKAADLVRVYPVAAVSWALSGKEMCDFSALKAAGAVAVTDDGMPVSGSLMMRRALEQAGKLGLPVMSHSEELELAAGGSMNEGRVAAELGYAGIPNAAESIMVMRDIALCKLTGSPLHIAHVSTRESVQVIRDAKRRGVRVTAETAPHYFTLTDAAVRTCGANAKMNPPLRSSQDQWYHRAGNRHTHQPGAGGGGGAVHGGTHPQDVHQPGPDHQCRQRVGSRSACGYHRNRPAIVPRDRCRFFPVQKPQYPLSGMGSQRQSRDDDRGREGGI